MPDYLVTTLDIEVVAEWKIGDLLELTTYSLDSGHKVRGILDRLSFPAGRDYVNVRIELYEDPKEQGEEQISE